jgi:hypothetical protein
MGQMDVSERVLAGYPPNMLIIDLEMNATALDAENSCSSAQ